MRTGRPMTCGSECAVFRYLRDHGPAESTVIADAIHRAWKPTLAALNTLHACGLIHVAAWRPVTVGGGWPAKVWAFGYGEDAPRPPARDAKAIRRESWHRRRAHLAEQYGDEVARKIYRSRNNGGADRIVIDGRTVYERGKPFIKGAEA